MTSNSIRKDEQIKLIMECRKSGLTDYQWCETKDIKPSTFYNWVSKLKKAGYTFANSESKNTGVSVKQEVVKVDLVEREISRPPMMEQKVSFPAIQNTPSAAAEIQIGAITLRLFNGADPIVIENTLKCIGGAAHAW